MRRRWLFSAVLATAAGSFIFWCPIPAQAQKLPKRCLPHPTATRAPEVLIDHVTFDRTDLPAGTSEAELIASLRERAAAAGSVWLPAVRRAVRDAWQDAGYFSAVPTIKARANGAGAGHLALTIHVDPGPTYRLSRILVQPENPGGKLLFSEETLRNLFPLNYGEIMNASKIREGLRAMEQYYGTRGYIDMTATPGFHLHAKDYTISINVFVDQGKQYHVGQLTILGLDPSLESLLKSKLVPGDIFNWDRVLDFYQSQQAVLPPHASPEDDQVYRVPKTDKVDVWLDFRACPAQSQAKSPLSAGLH
jgi:Surface antigen variable number repeat